MKLKDKIIKELRSIYYYHKYGNYNRFFVKYPKLDVLLIYLENIKVKSVSREYHYYIFVFEDGTKIKFWNSSRWYSWMTEGHAKFANGKELKWSNREPSSEVLFKYKKFVLEYEKKIPNETAEEENNNYSEYLPIKLSRREKLLKLK